MSETTGTEILLRGVQFPECPRWHQDKLWFSDMLGRRVLCVDSNGNATTVAEFDSRPSGLGFLPDGTLIVVLYHRQRLVRVRDGAMLPYADLGVFGGDHLNDMIIDGAGRAYVGLRMRLPAITLVNPRDSATDLLVRVDPDGKMSIAAEHLVTPNGIALSGDGKRLVVNESRAARLKAFTVGPDGSLHEPRDLATLAEGIPDGLCMDAEGAVWVATLDANSFVRISESGEVLESIRLRANTMAIACTLGGPDRRTLFMATKPGRLVRSGILEDLSDPARADALIETAKVAVPGAGVP